MVTTIDALWEESSTASWQEDTTFEEMSTKLFAVNFGNEGITQQFGASSTIPQEISIRNIDDLNDVWKLRVANLVRA